MWLTEHGSQDVKQKVVAAPLSYVHCMETFYTLMLWLAPFRDYFSSFVSAFSLEIIMRVFLTVGYVHRTAIDKHFPRECVVLYNYRFINVTAHINAVRKWAPVVLQPIAPLTEMSSQSLVQKNKKKKKKKFTHKMKLNYSESSVKLHQDKYCNFIPNFSSILTIHWNYNLGIIVHCSKNEKHFSWVFGFGLRNSCIIKRRSGFTETISNITAIFES